MQKVKTVSKFGGSSVIKFPKIIKEIVESKDRERNFIVVSAPGKIDDNDIKLTDILISISKKDILEDSDIKKSWQNLISLRLLMIKKK